MFDAIVIIITIICIESTEFLSTVLKRETANSVEMVNNVPSSSILPKYF